MKIYKDEWIGNFEFWSGAIHTVKHLTDDEMYTIEGILDEIYPDGLSETEINDIFWHEADLIAEWLGYNNFEEIMEREED